MIHTAIEIYQQAEEDYLSTNKFPDRYEIMVKAINEARIEAIKECSDIAKDILEAHEGTDFGVPYEFKQLIDQIK